jgi:hypothetical protein
MLTRSPIIRFALAGLLSAAIALAAAPRALAAAADSLERGVVVVTNPHVDSLITAALARMVGVVPGSDTLVAWDVFRAHPQRTVDLILPTLRPVKRGLALGAPNMVWRVRVLQRLTGLEYRGRTKAHLAPDEAAHLLPDTLRRVRFAGEDAKLGMTWVAPADAQKAIIAAWRTWWANDEHKPNLPITKHTDDKTWWY